MLQTLQPCGSQANAFIFSGENTMAHLKSKYLGRSFDEDGKPDGHAYFRVRAHWPVGKLYRLRPGLRSFSQRVRSHVIRKKIKTHHPRSDKPTLSLGAAVFYGIIKPGEDYPGVSHG